MLLDLNTAFLVIETFCCMIETRVRESYNEGEGRSTHNKHVVREKKKTFLPGMKIAQDILKLCRHLNVSNFLNVINRKQNSCKEKFFPLYKRKKGIMFSNSKDFSILFTDLSPLHSSF